MWKFIQWGLATVVAVGLIAAIANQILSASTGRARDVSVASLKEKLARLEAERPPKAVAPVVAQEESEPTPAALDLEALRKRWLVLLEQFDNASKTCPLDRKYREAIAKDIIFGEDADLTEDDRELLREHQTCMRAMVDELAILCEQHVDLRDLYSPEFRADAEAVLYGFNAASWDMREQVLLHTYEAEYQRAIESYRTLIELSRLHNARFSRGDMTVPRLIQRALASGSVDDVIWQRLLDSMAARREAPILAAEVQAESEELLLIYENWPQSVHFTFSEYPLNYAQNWAYRHVTTPMFNHDLEKFSRAMEVLVDLAPLPYYEARPGLEQFYEDFDVEPSVEDLKFTRGNPSWMYVLKLSREHFEHEAWFQASLDVTRIAILLERYKGRTGAYPESLDAIAEELGGSVPLCPTDGAPYVYERREATYYLEYRFLQEHYVIEEFGVDRIATVPWFTPEAPEKGTVTYSW